jgi:hypothetical protein
MCEKTLGMKPREAMAACQVNCAEARDLALEASQLYGPLPSWPARAFTGTVAELHARLTPWRATPCAALSAGPRYPTAWVMRSSAWLPLSAPREWSFEFSRNNVLGRDSDGIWSNLQHSNLRRSNLSTPILAKRAILPVGLFVDQAQRRDPASFRMTADEGTDINTL